MSKKKMTMGLIVGNRGFFPDHLANSGREEMIAVLQKAGMEAVVLSPQESKCGAVTTREDVHRCVELFKKNRDHIDGIIVTCLISEKSAPSPTHCGWRTCRFRYWYRQRPTTPGR